jgi:hypothetical protein
MTKDLNPKENESTIIKNEGKILAKLFALSNQETPLIGESELRDNFTDSMNSSNFDFAIENLIVGGFVSRIGNNEYQITLNGIDEHSRRNNKDLLF